MSIFQSYKRGGGLSLLVAEPIQAFLLIQESLLQVPNVESQACDCHLESGSSSCAFLMFLLNFLLASFMMR